MVRLRVAVLVAMGLSIAAPVMAKEGCGNGDCGPGYHKGPKGRCQPN